MSKSAKKYRLHTDSEGGLVLTAEFMRDAGVKTGDEYAAWKTSKGVMVVFKKNERGKRKIPKPAHRGKVEAALPETIAESADYKYVLQEYGATRKQVKAAEQRAIREIDADRKAGRLVEFTGKLPRILHLNLHRKFFGAIAAKTKRIEYRRRTAYWKTRLEKRKYDVIQFRNGYATNAPEMQVEFLGVRRIKKDGKNVYAIRLGKILKIKRWRN